MAKVLHQSLRLRPRPVLSWDKAERIWRNWEVWQDRGSIVHRLPDHYKRRYWQTVLSDAKPVHYEPAENRVEPATNHQREAFGIHFDVRVYGQDFEKETYPIRPIKIPEADRGLWGGDGVVKGYRVSRPYTKKKVLPRHLTPRFWYPYLTTRILYSEILDKYMQVVCTELCLRQIDECYGLDFYLLRTPEIDLNSKLGGKLKRELLLALADRSYYPDDPEKHREITDRYAEFRMPREAAEWVGLDLNDACRKQQLLEQQTRLDARPAKFDLERQLLDRLRIGDKALEEELD